MFNRKKIGRRCLAALLALSLCLGPVAQVNAARTNGQVTAKIYSREKTGKKRKNKKEADTGTAAGKRIKESL